MILKFTNVAPGLLFLSFLFFSACAPSESTQSVQEEASTAIAAPPTNTEEFLPLESEATTTPSPVPQTTVELEVATPTPSPTPPLEPTALPQFAGASQWLASMPGVKFNYLNSTRDGGYLLLGTVDPYDSREHVLIRLNDRGEILWQRHFTNSPDFHGVVETDDGGIVLTAMWGLTKLDSSGEFQWYQSLASDEAGSLLSQAMQSLQSSHIDSTGRTIAPGGAIVNFLDRDGSFLAQKIPGNQRLEGSSTTWTTADARWSAGMEEGAGFWVMRDSPNGPSWVQTFDFSNFDITLLLPPDRILGTRDGGAVMVTPVRHLIRPAFALWVVRMDRSGNILWQTAIDGVDDLELKVHESEDGGFVIASQASYFGAENVVFFLRVIRINAYGNLVWDRFYGDEDWQVVPGAIVSSADGGFVIGGDIDSSGSEMGGNIDDLFLLKVDRDGKVLDCPWLRPSAFGPPQRKSAQYSLTTISGIEPLEAAATIEKIQLPELEVHDSQWALSPLCAYPPPPPAPTPTSLPTPDPVPTEHSKIYPIAIADGTLLGAVSGDDWIQQSDLTPSGEELRFHLYASSGYRGEALGSIARRAGSGVCPGARTISFASIPDDPAAVAISGGWSAQSQRADMLSPTLRIYQDVLRDWLRSAGIDDPQINIGSIYRVDLEGDGIDEVLMGASWYSEGLTTLGASAGDYTVVLLRKLIGGEVQNLALVEHVYDAGDTQAVPQEYDVAGILDLNGDGTMEIVLHGRSALGNHYFVFEPAISVNEPVLQVVCAAR